MGKTPDIPDEFFDLSAAVDSYKPAARNPALNQFFTYVYPASGADLCRGTTVAALEIATWAEKTEVNSTKDHFTFFTLSQQSSGVLNMSYSMTVSSKLMHSNCTDGLNDRIICYSYATIDSLQGLENVKYIGVSNIQATSKLMTLPINYTTNYYFYYYWRERNLESDFSKMNLTRGNVPALRLYYSKWS